MLLTGVTAAQQSSSTASESVKPAAAPGPTNNVRPAIKWNRSDYTCEAGAKLTVYLHDTVAKVRTQDHIYMMRQAHSADGNRYSDGKILWWGKGDTGFLQEDTPDGDGKMLVKGCVLDKPAEAAKP
jgi:membrane-bound inhibitor of C-type lysozyme